MEWSYLLSAAAALCSLQTPGTLQKSSLSCLTPSDRDVGAEQMGGWTEAKSSAGSTVGRSRSNGKK